jgi:NADPH2:quinone reductase
MKTLAIRIHEIGDPSVMKWEEVDIGEPGPDEILLRHTAIGFNMIDTYHRSGLYPTPPKPCGLGGEAAGVVEAVGKKIKRFKPGDHVAYSGSAIGLGAYAEARIVKTDWLIKLPRWMDDRMAAAILTKGRTVEYLFNRTHKLKEGETVLFHAAAGGVGLIAGQWAKSVGAIAIGVVGSPEKAKVAKRNGYKHVIVVGETDIAETVMRITKGRGVDVVYDSVGKDSWQASLDSVTKLGLVVSFGSASGDPPLYNVSLDGRKNSAFIHRATMPNYMTTPEIAAASAAKVFAMIRKGAIKARIDDSYRLKDVARLHRDAEARKTTGQVVILP